MLLIPAILINIALLWTRLLGYTITISNCGWMYVSGVKITSRTQSGSIEKLRVQFHRPRYTAPCFLTLSAINLENKEPHAHSTVEGFHIRCLLFPVQLAFTAGPWIECHFEGFRVQVFGSKETPEWLAKIRNNVIHTILTGETIRLNSLRTKAYISKDTSIEQVEEQGANIVFVDTQDDTVPYMQHGAKEHRVSHKDQKKASIERSEEDDKEAPDDLRVHATADQWHILNHTNWRIYSFDSVEVEMRRSWLDSRGSLVMINKECKWTKVPWSHETAWSTGSNKYGPAISIWGYLLAIPSLFSIIVLAMYNALTMVNVHINRMDITFTDFHLRDAQALKEGLAKLRQKHQSMEKDHPGLLGDIAWNTFTNFVNSVVAAS